MRFNEVVRCISEDDEYFYNIVNYARLATIRDLIVIGMCVFIPYSILCELVYWGYLLPIFGGGFLLISGLLFKFRFFRYLSSEEVRYMNYALSKYAESKRVFFDRTHRRDTVVVNDKYKTKLRLGMEYISTSKSIRVKRCFQLKGSYRLVRYRYKLLRG